MLRHIARWLRYGMGAVSEKEDCCFADLEYMLCCENSPAGLFEDKKALAERRVLCPPNA